MSIIRQIAATISILFLFNGCSTTNHQNSAKQSITYHIDFKNSPIPYKDVNISVFVPGSIKKFKAPNDYGGAPMFLKFVTKIEANDLQGEPLKIKKSKNIIEVSSSSEKSYILKYTYSVPQKVSGEVDQSLPNLNNRYGRFDNNTIFLIPIGAEKQKAKLTVSPPDGWKVFTGWGSGNEFDSLKVSDVASGMIALGDFKYSSKQMGSTTLNFAIKGDFDHELLKDQFKKVFKAQQVIGGQLPNKQFLVVFQPTEKGCCKGTALKNSLVVNIPSSTKLRPFNFSAIGTASHELFHQWNFQHVYPASEYGAYLFTEGFTNYFAVSALVRAKLIKPESYAWFLWHYRNLLEKNPKYPGATYDMIQSGFKTNNDNLISLAYTKGPFVAVLLDLALREDSNGKQSLSSWFRTLSNRYGGKKGYTVSDLRNLIVEISGKPNGKSAKVFDYAFVNGAKLDLNSVFTKFGISCVNSTRKCKLKKLSKEMTTLRDNLFSAKR